MRVRRRFGSYIGGWPGMIMIVGADHSFAWRAVKACRQ